MIAMRISRQTMFMEMAKIVSKRSTCFRLNVGCVLVKNNRVVSCGYNGTPPGEPHCRGNRCPGRDGCNLTIHAEDNAIRYLSVGMPDDAYITDSPCIRCAELLKATGIKRVFFETPYRNTDPLHWLKGNHVDVFQVTPSGYCIDWFTKEIME